MAEAGVNLVTVGVFSWARLQPAPGALTAGWLDRVLDLLAGAGISVDLATATASPPAWLDRGPPRDPAGHRGRDGAWLPARASTTARAPRPTGPPPPTSPSAWRSGTASTRPSPCGTSATSTAATSRPATARPSARAFRRWLAGALRRRWARSTTPGAARSGARTTPTWDQIEPPRTAPTFANPAQQLDFARFSSDELLDCYRAERAVLAAAQPRPAGHDQLHGPVPPGGPVPLVGRARRRVRGQLPGPGRRRGPHRLGHGLRPDPVGGRRAARGC